MGDSGSIGRYRPFKYQELEHGQIVDTVAVERDARVSGLRDGARLRLPKVCLHKRRCSAGDRGVLAHPRCRGARSDPITQSITAR